jgi:hypothetical protein
MADFSDVVGFAEAHRACGLITPTVTSESSGAYTLTLRCPCGATHERHVSADEAAHAPVAARVPATATARRPEPPRITPSPDLLRVMQEALEAEEALERQDAPAAEVSTSATRHPDRDGPRIAPSAELEAVLRAAIEAEDAAATAAPPITPSPSTPSPSSPPSAPTALPSKRLARVAPLANVDDTVRAALRDHDRLQAVTDERARVADAPLAPPKPRTMWLALATLVLLAAVGAAVYVIDAPDADVPPTSGVARTVR